MQNKLYQHHLFCMFTGICCMSTYLSRMSTNFTEKWLAHKRQKNATYYIWRHTFKSIPLDNLSSRKGNTLTVFHFRRCFWLIILENTMKAWLINKLTIKCPMFLFSSEEEDANKYQYDDQYDCKDCNDVDGGFGLCLYHCSSQCSTCKLATTKTHIITK